MRFLLCLASYRLSKWGKSCQAPFSGRISVFKEREVFWGTPLGAPIRNSLFHLENGKSVIVRHGAPRLCGPAAASIKPRRVSLSLTAFDLRCLAPKRGISISRLVASLKRCPDTKRELAARGANPARAPSSRPR